MVKYGQYILTIPIFMGIDRMTVEVRYNHRRRHHIRDWHLPGFETASRNHSAAPARQRRRIRIWGRAEGVAVPFVCRCRDGRWRS